MYDFTKSTSEHTHRLQKNKKNLQEQGLGQWELENVTHNFLRNKSFLKDDERGRRLTGIQHQQGQISWNPCRWTKWFVLNFISSLQLIYNGYMGIHQPQTDDNPWITWSFWFHLTFRMELCSSGTWGLEQDVTASAWAWVLTFVRWSMRPLEMWIM